MRAAGLVLALAAPAAAFVAPRPAVQRAAPVSMVDASSLVTAYRELYEIGGIQVTADTQQFGPIGGILVLFFAANTLYMTMGDDDAAPEAEIPEYQFGAAVLGGAKAADAPSVKGSKTNAEWRAACDASGVVSYYDFGVPVLDDETHARV